MKEWLFHSLRGHRRRHDSSRASALPAVRSSHIERLEDRRMLTVTVQTLNNFTGLNGDGDDAQGAVTVVGSTLFGMTEQGGNDGNGTRRA